MNMSISIKELNEITTKTHNAAIEEAAKILVGESDWYAVMVEKTHSQREREDYTDQAGLCERLAELIRDLKRT